MGDSGLKSKRQRWIGSRKNPINNDQHRSRVATAALCQKVLSDDIEVALIQEPWTSGVRVMGNSTAKYKMIYDTGFNNPWACIYGSRKVEALLITNLC